MDYYLQKHMPFVMEKFKQHGLKRWEVLEYKPGPDGSKPPYSVSATLIFDSPVDLGAAMGSPEGGLVIDDTKNFSNKGPIFLGGTVVGTS